MEILKGRFAAGDAIDIDIARGQDHLPQAGIEEGARRPPQPAGLLTGEKEAEPVVK